MSNLTFEVADHVALLTINRPEARNAATLALSEAMVEAIDRIDADPGIRAIVLTGAGGHFCAGMDLKGFLRGELPKIPGRGFAGMTEAPPKTPIIAAVEGYALGGGFELALACDMIVAADTARFGLPEVKRGLVARAGGLLRLPRQMPQRIAMELLMTGRMLPPDEALRLGLINRVVPEGGALEAARALAAEIAANGPLAVAAVKEVVMRQQDWPAAEGFTRQAEFTDPIFASDDAKEGALAFAEKRAPHWTGR
ncbi:crotonase/enoyl-CoA hydratase family protein [Antarcticimicrobium sediminis]|uniref:Crotonase/enoyl-CoA hydratase family protein n=1 Tax=Antarcticimicrobium sediminis TaxID=2546227 RepID=A0A4R5ELU0_9RHOB|nr:crotonase/enoyl-CoA hydratase family protein [Antarcticimicrobium sediminis]TDE35661.1 crotonase/enoyl-CoA hydratase family protein [Antarcticimicrobium sediminis]